MMMQFEDVISDVPALFAQSVTVITPGGGGPSASISWAIVLFFTILGLLVTLSPPKRTYEIKKPKED
jgi:hypothetical protein